MEFHQENSWDDLKSNISHSSLGIDELKSVNIGSIKNEAPSFENIAQNFKKPRSINSAK